MVLQSHQISPISSATLNSHDEELLIKQFTKCNSLTTNKTSKAVSQLSKTLGARILQNSSSVDLLSWDETCSAEPDRPQPVMSSFRTAYQPTHHNKARQIKKPQNIPRWQSHATGVQGIQPNMASASSWTLQSAGELTPPSESMGQCLTWNFPHMDEMDDETYYVITKVSHGKLPRSGSRAQSKKPKTEDLSNRPRWNTSVKIDSCAKIPPLKNSKKKTQHLGKYSIN